MPASEGGRYTTLHGPDAQWHSGNGLEGAAGGGTGGPGPLEVEAAQVSGDVNHFTDKKKAGYAARLHGFAGKFAGVDAACGDFCLLVAFGGAGSDGPVVDLLLECEEGGVGPG